MLTLVPYAYYTQCTPPMTDLNTWGCMGCMGCMDVYCCVDTHVRVPRVLPQESDGEEEEEELWDEDYAETFTR